MTVTSADGLIGRGAGELARLVRDGEVSARELVDAHVRRIEEVNPRLNAVVVPLFEQAREAAAAGDEARTRGAPLGPLHGVPVTIKEQLRVTGTPTSLGLRGQAGWRASDEGPLVTRLRRAGAIILGKTNVSQTLIFHEADNPEEAFRRSPDYPANPPVGS